MRLELVRSGSLDNEEPVDKNMENVNRGYLPVENILQIVSATGFKASFKIGDRVEFSPLVAWAFLRDGTLMPLLYDKPSRSHVVAYAVTGFIEIVHDDFFEEEVEEDEEEEDKYED